MSAVVYDTHVKDAPSGRLLEWSLTASTPETTQSAGWVSDGFLM
jgi:hypothetical protein